MSVKSLLMNLIEKSSILTGITHNLFNRLKLNGNQLLVSDIHFRSNDITMQGQKQSLSCGKESFIADGSIKMHGQNNVVEIADNTKLYGENINAINIYGDNNHIIIGSYCNLRKVNFFVRGSNNTIVVGNNCSAYNVGFHIEQNNNEIHIGKDTTMHGREEHAIHLALDEGSKIIIDEDCMIAHSVQMRSTDSHSIVDLQGNRINPAKDIHIGSHCWIGMQSIILKGTTIQPHCVVAAGTVCSKEYNESNCILAGNPARIVKREIDWDRKFV